MNITRNIAAVKSTLPESVTLVAVSKFHPIGTLQEAYNAGQRVFGENRVQELAAKQPLMPPDVEWHFIGTLQSNKIKYIAPFIHTIQSVDSLNLLKKVNLEAMKCNRQIRVLLEVHIAGEASKHGFGVDECRSLVREGRLEAYTHVRVAGLMGMATYTDNQAQIRQEFQTLRRLYDELKSTGKADAFTELSMGMSDDYRIAIEEGSTMIRLGSLIFGKRK
ncbi:MAG: YggS family pyridoxal phosphate-dependent enzyme [Dysgonamonadaceae bacterium]|jgi:pyridoxal phosphate enzyme (YggS family)|nr:YggS family pyridoxal phosphate-dependent enzyme [Dysgonamonadaceae bacterium]